MLLHHCKQLFGGGSIRSGQVVRKSLKQKMIKMFGTKLVILGLWSVSTAQVLTCPTGVTKPSTFYVIGASGGDIKVKFTFYLLVHFSVQILRQCMRGALANLLMKGTLGKSKPQCV